MAKFVEELKRRNVFRAALAYTVVWWLLVQVAGLLLDAFEAPAWIFQLLIMLLALGFPIAMILAWFFELTPSGLVRDDEVLADPARYPAIRQHLDLVIIGLLGAAVIMFALDKFVWTGDSLTGPRAEVASPGATAGSLAVLPFSNRSSLPEDAYFVDGIHDDLLTLLARIDALRVVSRTSVMRYRDTQKSIPEIGRELNVAYILEGGIQRAGDHVRINAQLIDAGNDEHLWAETYDRELSTENLFSIQSEIAKAIANALDAELSEDEEQRIATVPTDNLAAYEAYLMGRRSLMGSSVGYYDEAVEHFERAIALDPGYAEAFAGLCNAHLSGYVKTGDPQHFESAEAACLRSLELGADKVEVQVALGTLLRYNGAYQRAEAYQRAALAADPLNIQALIELGTTLGLQGRTAEAESTLLKAAALQPEHWPAHDALFNLYRSHDFRPDRNELAVQSAMRVVELAPDNAAAWNNLGTAYHGLQQFDAANAAWDRALELAPTRTAYTNRGLQYYYEGRYAEAAAMQLKATELAPSDHRAWGRLAESYRLLGGKEAEAAAAYERAIVLAEGSLRINPQDWRTAGQLATYYAYSGRGQEATAMADTALELSNRDPEALLYAALVAHRQGDEDATLSALEEMVERNDSFRLYAGQDPDLGTLAGNERFDRLVNP